MMKVIGYFIKNFLIFFLIISAPVMAASGAKKLEVTWLGTACVNISDGKNALFFDPFLTRPSIWDLIFLKSIQSKPSLVKNWLSKIPSNNISAIFTSHTHYDHSMDLTEVQKQTNSKVYGSISTLNILKGAGTEKSFESIKSGDVLKVGQFKITVLPGKHAPHIFGITFLDGNILHPLKAGSNFLEYKHGTSYNFLIEHPSGTILYHPSSHRYPGENFQSFPKVDVLIQGVASRKSNEDLYSKIVAVIKPKKLIFIHYDDFFKPLSEGPKPLSSVKKDEFRKFVEKKDNTIEILKLSYGSPLKFE